MQGDEISTYHLEARIASWHCVKEDSPGKWQSVLELNDQLLLVNFSPSAALNRPFPFYKVNGPGTALAEAEKLNMTNNPFYFVFLENFSRSTNKHTSISTFQQSYNLAGQD